MSWREPALEDCGKLENKMIDYLVTISPRKSSEAHVLWTISSICRKSNISLQCEYFIKPMAGIRYNAVMRSMAVLLLLVWQGSLFSLLHRISLLWLLLQSLHQLPFHSLHMFTNTCSVDEHTCVAWLCLSVGGAAGLCCSSLVIFSRLQQLLSSLPLLYFYNAQSSYTAATIWQAYHLHHLQKLIAVIKERSGGVIQFNSVLMPRLKARPRAWQFRRCVSQALEVQEER